MSSSRYPDSRYGRDRSPYRDRRPSTYSSGYPPRTSESSSRSNAESSGFPPRDTPRGPKSLVDAPRGLTAGAPSASTAAPRDGRGRGFAGRAEAPSLRDAPPLSSNPHPHPHNSWRADRDRDRDYDRDRRDRRPSPPPRRSPARDARDSRDQRDFAPRDLDIGRARRNSRDGPPSAGSTYSDPPLGTGSSYRGSGIGRGRGGRDFHGDVRPRGRNFHNDDRDRHHDARDRIPPERSYRPRSRSRDPVRRERDPRDDRDFDRRDRDDRRYAPREYDSYVGSAGPLKSGPRAPDTHRTSGPLDSRHPGTPTGTAPHSTHHSPADRFGPLVDSFSRRSSIATEALGPKDGRREPGRDDALLASRAEASRERYGPRASSPPAAVPAFGFSSNVWRNPALDAKTTSVTQLPKPALPASSAPVATSTPAPAPPPPTPTLKPGIPSGLSTAPPTGPKADRVPERPQGDSAAQTQESRPPLAEQPRIENRPPLPTVASASNVSGAESGDTKPSAPLNAAQTPANSPAQGPAAKTRLPLTGLHAALRPNVSPSFPKPAHLPYAARDAPRDASPSAAPSPMASRSSSTGGNALGISTSPRALPANIPTGPKADRAPMAVRPSPMYPPSDRPGFPGPRLPMGGAPKSMQWVRPGLNLNNRAIVPTKREFPAEERDRPFGTMPKAPKLEDNASAVETRSDATKPGSPSLSRSTTDPEPNHNQISPADNRKEESPKPGPIETRRFSDVSMADTSPHPERPPVSAASSAPEVLGDSDDDLDLDDADFAESEAKYNREKALLESKRIDLSAPHLRATTPLSEIILLASLTTDHLPSRESKPIEEPTPMVPEVQLPPESITTELPTPRAEESEDVVMDENEAKPLAPATQALRLRRGASDDQDENVDYSSLPYLGSGPPTPVSEIEGPRVSDTVMSAIRDKLRKSIEPRRDTEDIFEQYAAAYRNWRLFIRELDDVRDIDDHERQPSAEPGIKVTTPDVQSSAMAPLLDLPPQTTGRRSHSSRWATELDLEAVIKESLKTAEEERMGKKEREPKRSLADPEKEAEVPQELTAYEAQRRRFIDTNFQREPGQGIFVFHYEPPEDDFTEEEHKIMVQNYRDQYAKKWGKLAEMLHKEAGSSRTYKDCINHYYATKWGREYKGKVKGRRGGPRRRGGGAGRGRGAIANMERNDAPGEDGLPPALTETGRPRRSAAPTFGAETDPDTTTSTPTPGRLRRQTDADGTQEKVGRRGKAGKEKGGRKGKGQTLVAAPAGSPVKLDRKAPGVKMEDELQKRVLGDLTLPVQVGLVGEQMVLPTDAQFHPGLAEAISERPKQQSSSRAGPSSYWSVTEQTDFQRNVAHFGTDWAAIANHMGTKTQTMVKNQYLRLVESGGASDLERFAQAADRKRGRGEDLGPPPTPTPTPKRRYESTTTIQRPLAPTPEIPVSHPTSLPKASPTSSTPGSRFSNIAQAPQSSKPQGPVAGYGPPDPSLSSLPGAPQQQHSPPGHPSRNQPHHPLQHSLSQPDRRPGPRAGFFSDELPPREHGPPSQPSNIPQTSRPLQSQAVVGSVSAPRVQPPGRAHEPPQGSLFRPPALQEHESLLRAEQQQDHEMRLRYEAQHARRISGDVGHNRQYPAPGPGMAQMRAVPGGASPENHSLPLQHRHMSQSQPGGQPLPDTSAQIPGAMPLGPPRSNVATPPVKEEPRHYPLPNVPPPPQPSQGQVYPPTSQPSQGLPAPPAPPASKPAAEPRKSNLMSLLNDAEPEEPRRKKPIEQNIPSHTPTPQQQTPIAPPPPVSSALPPRRELYNDPATSQASYGRPSYAQPPSLPQMSSGRPVVDLTGDQGQGGRVPTREGWQRQPYSSQGQPPAQGHNSPHSALAQPAFGDSRMFTNHRSVAFAQHNAPRHNPSPPPHAAYSNSPHLHSRTPSISGPAGQPSRHGLGASSTPQPAASASQLLQSNPYAQVDPPGSNAQPSGAVGMRPSPHHHTSHVGGQREIHGRNEQSQVHNGALSYSNPHTPSEHHATGHHSRGASMTDPYRQHNPHYEVDSRNPERDISREISHRADMLRDSLLSRSAGPPPGHQDARYPPPPLDRGYPTQRSHTPLSRSEHAPPPSLQHPPGSALASDRHPLYAQQTEDRFRDSYSRDSRIADRIREEQAQQQAAMRDDYLNREREREIREREMRERNAYHDSHSLLRRGQPPPPPGQPQDQRGGPASQQMMDWASAVRPPAQDRWTTPR